MIRGHHFDDGSNLWLKSLRHKRGEGAHTSISAVCQYEQHSVITYEEAHHVKHTVGLIQHKVRTALQISRWESSSVGFHGKKVIHTTRRCHDNVNTSHHLAHLLPFWHTTIYTYRYDPHHLETKHNQYGTRSALHPLHGEGIEKCTDLSKFCALIVYLYGKLASRSQHDTNWAFAMFDFQPDPLLNLLEGRE